MPHEVVNFRDWSGVGLGHDDTSKLQEAIDQVKGNANSVGRALGRLRIPAGVYKFTSLLLDRSVTIEGDGKRATTLASITSQEDGLVKISVAHDGYDYYAAGGTPADVVLKDLTIQGNRDATSPSNGLVLKNALTNSVYTSVKLTDVNVTHAPQNGIASPGPFYGFLRMHGGFIRGNVLDGISGNSVVDWHFTGTEIGVNSRHGILLSGCGMMQFDKCYTYANGEKGLYNYNSSVNFMNAMLDRNGTGGYFHDIRNPKNFARLFQVWFGLNSRALTNTYSDILVGYSSTVDLQTNSCTFAQPQVGTGGVKHNFAFENYASVSRIHSQFNRFDVGDITSPNVASHINRVNNTA